MHALQASVSALHLAEDPRTLQPSPDPASAPAARRMTAAAWRALTLAAPWNPDIEHVPGLLGRLLRHSMLLPRRNGHTTQPEPWRLDWAATEPETTTEEQLWCTASTAPRR